MIPSNLAQALASRKSFVDESSEISFGEGKSFNEPTSLTKNYFYEKSGAGFVGLINEGATCYLNSLLQTLFMQRSFRKNLYSWSYESYQHGLESGCLTRQLQILFANLHLSERGTISTKPLLKSFGWTSSEIFQQQDIQECLTIIFDFISQQCNHTPFGNYLHKTFYGHLHHILICSNCHVKRLRYETFRELQLEVKGFETLESSLRSLLQFEVVEGVNCEHCQGKHNHQKAIQLQSLPEILTIHLKRFDLNYHTMQRMKLSNPLSIPQIINLSPFLPPSHTHAEHHDVSDNSNNNTSVPDIDASQFNYELEAVLVHVGSALAGHYFCYLKDHNYHNLSCDTSSEDMCSGTASGVAVGDQSDRWILFNDSQVTALTEEQVQQIFATDPAANPTGTAGTEVRAGSTVGPSAVSMSGREATVVPAARNGYMLLYRHVLSRDRELPDADPEGLGLIPEDIRLQIQLENEKYLTEKREWEVRQSQIPVRVRYGAREEVIRISKNSLVQELRTAVYQRLFCSLLSPESPSNPPQKTQQEPQTIPDTPSGSSTTSKPTVASLQLHLFDSIKGREEGILDDDSVTVSSLETALTAGRLLVVTIAGQSGDVNPVPVDNESVSHSGSRTQAASLRVNLRQFRRRDEEEVSLSLSVGAMLDEWFWPEVQVSFLPPATYQSHSVVRGSTTLPSLSHCFDDLVATVVSNTAHPVPSIDGNSDGSAASPAITPSSPVCNSVTVALFLVKIVLGETVIMQLGPETLGLLVDGDTLFVDRDTSSHTHSIQVVPALPNRLSLVACLHAIFASVAVGYRVYTEDEWMGMMESDSESSGNKFDMVRVRREDKLSDFKSELASLLHLDEHSFRLHHHQNRREYKDLTSSFQNILHSHSTGGDALMIAVVLGKPLAVDEFRIKVYLYTYVAHRSDSDVSTMGTGSTSSRQHDMTPYIYMTIHKSHSVTEIKNILSIEFSDFLGKYRNMSKACLENDNCHINKGDTGHDTIGGEQVNVRLRRLEVKEKSFRVGSVLFDRGVLSEMISNFHDGVSIAVQVDVQEKEFLEGNILIEFRFFRPAVADCVAQEQPTVGSLSSPYDVIIDRETTLFEFKQMVAQILHRQQYDSNTTGFIYDAQQILVAKAFAWQVRDVSNISSLKWLPGPSEDTVLSKNPWRVCDGTILIARDMREGGLETPPVLNVSSSKTGPYSDRERGFQLFTPEEQASRNLEIQLEDELRKTLIESKMKALLEFKKKNVDN